VRRRGQRDHLADLAAEDQVETLIEDLTAFYITVRRGLSQ
jgi:hypothetical protein